MSNIIDATLRFVDKFTTPFQSAIRKAEENTKKLKNTGKTFEKTGKSITKTGTALTKTVTLPIVAAGAAALKTAAGFEQAMSKVQSISGATGDDMKKLSAKAREMGAKTKFSASEAADAFSYMAMAGWKTQDMMDGIEGVMYLAGASGENLATTSDIVTDALTAFGLTAKDTNKFVDILAAASNNANTNVSMLGESFKYCAPIAGAMKYDTEDVAVALGLMANSGIKASQAGTSLRSLLTRMADPTKNSVIAMEKLGVSLTDSKGKMYPFMKIMERLRDGMSNLTESEKARYASMLAGKAGMSGLLAITNASEKDFNKLCKAIDNSSGAAKKMYKIANNNFSGKFTILKSTLESIGINFGNILLPYANKALGKVQQLAEKVNGMSDKNKKLVVSILATVAAVGPAIIVFGKLTTGIGGLLVRAAGIFTFFKKIKNGVSILTALGPTGIAGVAVVGIIALVAAVALLATHWKQVKKTCTPVIKAMQSGVTKAVNAIQHALKTLQKNFIKVVNASGLNTKKLKQQFLSMSVKVTQNIANLKAIIASIAIIVKLAWTKIKPALNTATKTVVSVFNKVKKPLGSFVSFLVGVFTIKIRTQFAIVKSIALALFKSLIDIIDNVLTIFNGITTFLKGVFTANWRMAFQGLVDIVRGVFGGLVSVVKAPLNAVISLVNSMIGKLNGISIGVPKGLRKFAGGQSHIGFNVPTIPMLYTGTKNWTGGPAMIHDRGAEIVDLPSGSRVYPRDKSLALAYNQGKNTSNNKTQKVYNFNIGTVNASSKADVEVFCKMLMDMINNSDQEGD